MNSADNIFFFFFFFSFFFFRRVGYLIFHADCPSPFSGKNVRNGIGLSSTELASRMRTVK